MSYVLHYTHESIALMYININKIVHAFFFFLTGTVTYLEQYNLIEIDI